MEAAMKKTALSKSVALVVCLAFLGIAASGLLAAPRHSTYAEARQFLMKQITSLVSWLPYFDVVYYSQDPSLQITTDAAGRTAKVKPTGDIKVVRPGDGD
jgi:hypothetical protein